MYINLLSLHNPVIISPVGCQHFDLSSEAIIYSHTASSLSIMHTTASSTRHSSLPVFPLSAYSLSTLGALPRMTHGSWDDIIHIKLKSRWDISLN